jgi:hypothetical protein
MTNGAQAFAAAPVAMDVAAHSPQQGAQDTQAPTTGTATAGTGGTQKGNILVNRTMTSRCPMQTWQVTRNKQGKQQAQLVQYGPCFAGSWSLDGWNNSCASSPNLWGSTPPVVCPQYYNYPVWVVGRRHHHECHYVKGHGHVVGFVPRHPGDKPGQAPLNAKAGILTLSTERGKVAAGVIAAPKGFQVETHPPDGAERGIAKAGLQSAARVGQPVIQAKMAADILPPGMALANVKHPGAETVSAVRFDYKSGNFVGKTGEGPRGGGGHSVVVAHGGGGGGGIGGGGSHGGGGGGASGGGGSGGGGHSSGGSSGGGSSSAGSSGGGGGGGGGGHH